MKPAPIHRHCSAAEEYVDQVIAGEVTAGLFERLACERHRRDMARAEDGWRYAYDRNKAERVCNVIETFHHVKGRWAKLRQTIVLEPWQCFIICSIFGWVDRLTRHRRFQTVYLEVARKNAKSTLLSGVGIYCLAYDLEEGAEVYSAATTKEQARKVFDPARKMALQNADMRIRAGIEVQVHKLLQSRTNSEFAPLASQTHSLDGLNTSCGLVDELHAHKTREVWDVLGSGQGARDQPLKIAITTAGSDLTGVCYDERCDLEKVLREIVEDDSYFGVIFSIDDDDDPFDEEVWRKANPNLGVSVNLDFLRRESAKAQRSPAQKGEFLRKYCCRWSAAGVAAFDLDGWRFRARPGLSLEDLADCADLIAGLDGSKNDDLSSLVLVGRTGDDLLIYDEHWATEETIDAPGNEHLRAWVDQGWLHECAGCLIDTDAIERRLVEICGGNTTNPADPDGRVIEVNGVLKISEVSYDPQYLSHLASRLDKNGKFAPMMVEQKQSTLALDPALRTMQGTISERRAVHRGNPVMDWMISNSRAKPSHIQGSEFIKLFKPKQTAKIDGAQALVTALARMEEPAEAPVPSVYETRGILRL